MSWTRLPDIPDAEGLAGVLAGSTGGAIIVAGGANFPQGRPWDGGQKVWHDQIFVLRDGATEWESSGRLPSPIAYGVSVSHRDRVVCVGGSDASRHHADAFALRWDGKDTVMEQLPPLPKPLALHCGALIDDDLYVVGGCETPDATEATNAAYVLDLADPKGRWRAIEPMPGPGRILATAGAMEGCLYVVGGAGLARGADGKAERVWLCDAYRFKPGAGWERLPDLPRPVVGAPSPAVAFAGIGLVILGGDDGAQIGRDPQSHTGFRRDGLAIDANHAQWHPLEPLPFALVTTPAVPWKGGVVVPGGEIRPGVRSTAVWHGVPRSPSVHTDGGISQ